MKFLLGEKGNEFDFFVGENSDFANHFHENIEIIYILSGSRTLITADKKHQLHSGDLAVIMPYFPHEYNFSGGGECKWVGISPHLFKEMFTDNNFATGFAIIKNGEALPDTNALISLIFLNENIHQKSYYKSLISALLQDVKPLLNTKKASSVATDCAKFFEFTLNHYSDPSLCTETLSKQFGIPKRDLAELFKKTTNMPFCEFLNNVRADESAVMLAENPQLSVTEIAYKAGFGSIRTYNRFFKARYSLSPTEYKKWLKEKHNLA